MNSYFNGDDMMAITTGSSKRNLFGRRPIFLTPKNGNNQLTPEELGEDLALCFKLHKDNREEINYLYNYVRGIQPILTREDKIIRSEINNMCVENLAKYITNFKNGYIWGEPILLIKNSNGNSAREKEEKEKYEEEKDKKVLLLNEFFQERFKHNRDQECGLWTIIGGVGYKCVLPNDSNTDDIPFNLYTLDPRNTFIAYTNDFKKEPYLAVTYTKLNEDDYNMTIYSNNFVYTAISDKDFNITSLEVFPNILRLIPIIEFNYDNLGQGAFEHILPLLDNLNLLCSDRMNDIVQAVQWFMKFINVDISFEDYEKFKKSGAIVAKTAPGVNADIDVITTSLQQSDIQVFKDDMIRMALTLCNVPQRTADARDNTGESLIIGQGWTDAESDAKSVEAIQTESEKRLLKIVLAICKVVTSPPELKDVKLGEIDIRFSRNRTDNLLVKTQGLLNMLKAGIHPLLAFKNCGLFSDPQKAYELSKEYLEKFYESSMKNNEVAKIESNQNIHNQSMQVQSEIDKKGDTK